MEQNYEHYTQEDHEVWSILFRRQLAGLSDMASSEYLQGISRANFQAYRIPAFDQVSTLLRQRTGWELLAVPGIVEDAEFFKHLSRRRFPATAWIRSKSQLDYLEEPDLFHDVFGHVPLLSNQSYCDFLEGLSHIALKYIDSEYIIQLISRVYWFTVEFGLIEENGQTRIYGAGILSSPGESVHSLSAQPTRRPFSMTEILETAYRKDVYQSIYYVINNYDQLFNSLGQLDRMIQVAASEATTTG